MYSPANSRRSSPRHSRRIVIVTAILANFARLPGVPHNRRSRSSVVPDAFARHLPLWRALRYSASSAARIEPHRIVARKWRSSPHARRTTKRVQRTAPAVSYARRHDCRGPTRHTGPSMERAKLIVEPAGAAAVAALMTSAPELSLHGPDPEPVQPRLRPPPIRD